MAGVAGTIILFQDGKPPITSQATNQKTNHGYWQNEGVANDTGSTSPSEAVSSTTSLRELTYVESEPGSKIFAIDDSVSEVTFLMNPSGTTSKANFTTEQHKMKLLTPAGKEVSPKDAQSGDYFAKKSDRSKYEYMGTQNLAAWYYVKNPQPGNWKVSYNPDLKVSISPERESQQHIELSTRPPNKAKPGEAVDVNLHMKNLSSCTDRRVAINLQRQGENSKPLSITRKQSRDAYTATFTPGEPGQYGVSAMLRCSQQSEDGVRVVRGAAVPFRVLAVRSQAGNNTRDYLDRYDDRVARRLAKTRLQMRQAAGQVRPAFQFFKGFNSSARLDERLYADKQYLQRFRAYVQARKDLIRSPVQGDRFEQQVLSELISGGANHQEIKKQAIEYLNRLRQQRDSLFSKRQQLYNIALSNQDNLIVERNEATAESITFTDKSVKKRWSELLQEINKLESQVSDLTEGRIKEVRKGADYIQKRLIYRLQHSSLNEVQ